ncbi:MAG: hypothetical protein Q4G70_10060 [Pseudomonadota bacterium]|nr:hypothetical protein [Pseudomonadota bacterium]
MPQTEPTSRFLPGTAGYSSPREAIQLEAVENEQALLFGGEALPVVGMRIAASNATWPVSTAVTATNSPPDMATPFRRWCTYRASARMPQQQAATPSS